MDLLAVEACWCMAGIAFRFNYQVIHLLFSASLFKSFQVTSYVFCFYYNILRGGWVFIFFWLWGTCISLNWRGLLHDAHGWYRRERKRIDYIFLLEMVWHWGIICCPFKWKRIKAMNSCHLLYSNSVCLCCRTLGNSLKNPFLELEEAEIVKMIFLSNFSFYYHFLLFSSVTIALSFRSVIKGYYSYYFYLDKWIDYSCSALILHIYADTGVLWFTL